MKLLVIRFPDETTLFPKETEVTVTDGTDTITGTIMSNVDMVEPTVEGDYHIGPITPPP